MSNQCYFNGDFYQCVTATTAGESPTTAPAKWRKVKLPSKWRWVLAQLTYAHLLRLDGQTDKANVERNVATARDRVGLDELIRQEANEEQQRRGCHRGRAAVVNTGRTRPVAASVILDDAYRMIGWDADQLDARETGDARMALSLAVQEVWESWWWQELMVCAQTQFAETVVAPRSYVPGETVYDPAADAYFTNLFTALYNGTVPLATWNRWQKYEAGRGVLPAWSATTTYGDGDECSYGGTDYRCWQDTPVGTVPTDTSVATYFLVLRNWNPILPYTTSIQAGQAQTGPFGPIRSVSKFDPRSSANPQEFELDVTEAGTRVLALTVTHPWVWSRRVTPILTGAAFDVTATYEATETQDLVYDA